MLEGHSVVSDVRYVPGITSWTLGFISMVPVISFSDWAVDLNTIPIYSLSIEISGDWRVLFPSYLDESIISDEHSLLAEHMPHVLCIDKQQWYKNIELYIADTAHHQPILELQ